jgi:hypothetical protein
MSGDVVSTPVVWVDAVPCAYLVIYGRANTTLFTNV